LTLSGSDSRQSCARDEGPSRGRAGLLVLGARGTGGLARVLLGSVADGMFRLATVPVLVVK